MAYNPGKIKLFFHSPIFHKSCHCENDFSFMKAAGNINRLYQVNLHFQYLIYILQH